jgi:hypothetical protein
MPREHVAQSERASHLNEEAVEKVRKVKEQAGGIYANAVWRAY